jgi:pyridoxine 5-phosphate synthase
VRLGVNLDHVCTLRQARYRGEEWASFAEPRILEAARIAERAGAWQITVHLREDRRHLQDRDLIELRRHVRTRLNLEMALAPDVVVLALRVRPDRVTLVPERRQEVTTEGGLDVMRQLKRVEAVLARFRRVRIETSCFIAPEADQVFASAAAGSDAVELHTGAYARALTRPSSKRELKRLKAAARWAKAAGMAVYAGHGLTVENAGPVARIPEVEELNIGHSLVARALCIGLPGAVRDILRAYGGSS